MFIESQAYWQPQYLEREYERIFSRGMYVANRGLLQHEGDYVSYTVCGRPFVTRNFASAIRTYENVCLHRANLIDPVGSGNRPFRCGYHGWQYGADGAVNRTPLATEGCVKRSQLRGCDTVEHDGMVFVAPGDGWSGDFGREVFAQIGFSSGFAFHRDTLEHDANWKLLVENVLESYHLSFVHQDSFVPTGITSTSASSSTYCGHDSAFRIESKSADEAKAKVIPGASSDYVHAFVFPNLFVSITGGLIGFISHFKPAAHDRTTLEWELFETPLLQTQKTAVRNYIKKNAIEFTNKVLREDLAVLNQSQIGVRHAHGAHQLQEIEGRIAHFHQTYLEMMS
jgi:phenylpropionate dioxygenase-like ring-hydroxylating dioxygenase large terminal subunit